MGLVPNLWFTRLLGDFTREGLRSYVEVLALAIAGWEKDAAAEKFLTGDPLRKWLSPASGGEPAGENRIVDWRIGRDPSRYWCLAFRPYAQAYLQGSYFLDDERDESTDWRGYGDHLIRNAVADTTGNIDEMGYVRGLPSAIYLEKKLQGVAIDLAPDALGSNGSTIMRFSSAVGEELGCASLGKEILVLREKRKEVREFLTWCDTQLMERWGPSKFSQLLAPLGVTLKRWRNSTR